MEIVKGIPYFLENISVTRTQNLDDSDYSRVSFVFTVKINKTSNGLKLPGLDYM